MYYGSIELGGTKIRSAIFDDDGNLKAEDRIKTSNPDENMKEVVEFFSEYKIKSIGIGAFGPIDVDKDSDTYGYVLSTPKKLWKNFNLLASLKESLDIPMGLTTDVGASGLGEYHLGAAKDKANSLYLTIGTGIGGSYIQNGKLLEGFSHPEMGHIEISKDSDDSFEGVCDYHKSCFEGLCSGPAIEKRAGKKGEDLSISDPAIEISASYIAKALYTYTLVLRPHIIIIGGGVANKEGMIEKIREEFDKIKGDYLPIPSSEEYIVFPELGNEAGLIGGYILAKETARK